MNVCRTPVLKTTADAEQRLVVELVCVTCATADPAQPEQVREKTGSALPFERCGASAASASIEIVRRASTQLALR